MNLLKYVLNPEYRYFVKKRDGVKKMTWDHEFKRFKTLEIREEIRADASSMKQRLEVLLLNIKKEEEPGGLKETNADEFKRLEDQRDLLNRDITRREEQLKGIDIEVNGADATQESEAYAGINQTIDSLRELDAMLRDYAKGL